MHLLSYCLLYFSVHNNYSKQWSNILQISCEFYNRAGFLDSKRVTEIIRHGDIKIGFCHFVTYGRKNY